MQLDAPGVRIVDVETCDFGLMRRLGTADLLREALPDRAEAWLTSAGSRRMMAELGVEQRYLTHVPGARPDAARLNAFDLARSAVTRLKARRAAELERLDALIFVSTSNPNPCNSMAAMLAEEFGLTCSCMDIKAGCSGGVLGLMQAALLIRAGCARVLVVMAENLSQLTSPDEVRMLLTVGDGAACVLVEHGTGPGFTSMIHGTAPEYASSIAVRTPFPPASADAQYVYEACDVNAARDFLHDRWRGLFHESAAAAGIGARDLAGCFIHQTHGAQVGELVRDLGIEPARVPRVVGEHGNMGTPTFAVALARGFGALKPGDRYLLHAVGGGVSWCSIVAVHE